MDIPINEEINPQTTTSLQVTKVRGRLLLNSKPQSWPAKSSCFLSTTLAAASGIGIPEVFNCQTPARIIWLEIRARSDGLNAGKQMFGIFCRQVNNLAYVRWILLGLNTSC